MAFNTPSKRAAGAKPHRISSDEVKHICEAMEDETFKGAIAIAVCQKEASVTCLKDKYQNKLQFWRSTKVIPTTSKFVHKAVSNARENAKRRQTKLVFLVSPYVMAISFHVPARFRRLSIIRCDKRIRGTGDSHLIIPEDSTFCDIPLKQWQHRPKKLRNRDVFFQGDVFLGLELDDPEVGLGMPELSSEQRGKIMPILYKMKGLGDPTTPSDDSFWDIWKGAIAAILGILAGGTKFLCGLKVSGGGLYATHWFGAKVFGGYISSSAVLAASGPGAALAFGTAAAVYFIPWDKLWGFFRRLVGRAWKLLTDAWNWLRERLSSFSHVIDDLPPPYQPMGFQSA